MNDLIMNPTNIWPTNRAPDRMTVDYFRRGCPKKLILQHVQGILLRKDIAM